MKKDLENQALKQAAFDRLYELYGLNAMMIENSIYNLAEQMIEGYKGGEWYGDLHNGFPVFWPAGGDELTTVNSNNGAHYNCSLYAAGLGVSASIINWLCNSAAQNGHEKTAEVAHDHYYMIRDYVFNDDSVVNEKDQTHYFNITD